MSEPVIVWGDDPPDANRPPPRTEPPRHAEAMAEALYGRVAASAAPRRRRRFHSRGIAVGLVLMGIAGVVYYFDWDRGLLRLVSIALGGFGLISLVKGLLGYR